jgi:hypothetical protein
MVWATPVKEDTMRQPTTTHHTRPSRLWTVIEALAYAGAVIDPSGVLAVERLRRAEEDEQGQRHDRR